MFVLLHNTPKHIEGAKLIPLKNMLLHDHVNLFNEELLAWHIKNNKDLPKNKCTKILVYCLSGERSPTASQVLVNSGHKRVDNIQDCSTSWLNTRYPIVIDPDFWAVNYPNFH